mmetsp:Transcript_56405/g.174953  ORF Transcript_56405/g.174953 Transcript_56405/m.174953 type:complete len:111 (+) Transcript_56405:170-502(+)
MKKIREGKALGKEAAETAAERFSSRTSSTSSTARTRRTRRTRRRKTGGCRDGGREDELKDEFYLARRRKTGGCRDGGREDELKDEFDLADSKDKEVDKKGTKDAEHTEAC